ncbi:MAG: hypothetical protein ACFFAY_08005 [Promethearchaeota archaeon]
MIERSATDSYSKIVHLVESNVSSVDMISETLQLSPEEIREILAKLAQEGRIKGHLTTDGSRFFKSELRTSDAPRMKTMEDLEIPKTNTKPGVLVIVLGFAAYAIGNLLVRLGGEQTFLWGLGGAITLTGPIIILVGMFILSRLASAGELGGPRRN